MRALLRPISNGVASVNRGSDGFDALFTTRGRRVTDTMNGKDNSPSSSSLHLRHGNNESHFNIPITVSETDLQGPGSQGYHSVEMICDQFSISIY